MQFSDFNVGARLTDLPILYPRVLRFLQGSLVNIDESVAAFTGIKLALASAVLVPSQQESLTNGASALQN